MEKIFLIRLIASSLKWLAGFTRTKWDDKIANTVYNIIVGSPELIKDAEEIFKFGKDGYEDLREKYKSTKSKTKTVKVLYQLVSNAPRKEIKKVISSAKEELKKNKISNE